MPGLAVWRFDARPRHAHRGRVVGGREPALAPTVTVGHGTAGAAPVTAAAEERLAFLLEQRLEDGADVPPRSILDRIVVHIGPGRRAAGDIGRLRRGVISLAVPTAGRLGSVTPEMTSPLNFHHLRDTSLSNARRSVPRSDRRFTLEHVLWQIRSERPAAEHTTRERSRMRSPLAHGLGRPMSLSTTFSSQARSSLYLLLIVCALFFMYKDGLGYHLSIVAKPEHNYGIIIIIVGLYMIWQRWPLLKYGPIKMNWLAIPILSFASVLFFTYEAGNFIKLGYPSLLLFLFGMMVAARGWALARVMIAPFGLMALATPIPDYFYIQISTTLQQISSILGANMLHLFDIPVFRNGNIIDLGNYKLQVAEACSGLRYLIPLILTASCLVWLARAPQWVKIVTVISAVPLTVLLNSLRIALTGILVNLNGVAAAEGVMHFIEGWVIFIFALICIVGILMALIRLNGNSSALRDVLDFDRIEGRTFEQCFHAAPVDRARGRARVMVTSSAMLAALALLGPALEAREFDEPSRPELWRFPLQIGDYVGVPTVVDATVRDELGTSDSLLVDYERAGGSNVNFWLAYYGAQSSGGQIHSPKYCLPAGGWEYERLDRREIEVEGAPGDRPFRVNEAIAVKGPERVAMIYWMEARGRRLASETWNKVYLFYDSIAHGRTDGALVRVLTSVAEGESDKAAFARLYEFLDLSYVHVVPYVDS